jgi:ABC-2 type transport system ATP-binding protein
MSQPAVLFLDEPTSGVDPLGRADFWDVIYRFAEDGITSIVTTHFMDEAERCNILGMMNEGRLVAFGTPEELKKGLPTNFYEISASSVIETYSALIDRDYIDQVALFGDKIHVMTNKGEEYIRNILQGIGISIDNISRISPSLEDVFVYHVTVGRKEISR